MLVAKEKIISPTKPKVIYAEKGDELLFIAKHGDVLIVENKETKERFPCFEQDFQRFELAKEATVIEKPKFISFEGKAVEAVVKQGKKTKSSNQQTLF